MEIMKHYIFTTPFLGLRKIPEQVNFKGQLLPLSCESQIAIMPFRDP